MRLGDKRWVKNTKLRSWAEVWEWLEEGCNFK